MDEKAEKIPLKHKQNNYVVVTKFFFSEFRYMWSVIDGYSNPI